MGKYIIVYKRRPGHNGIDAFYYSQGQVRYSTDAAKRFECFDSAVAAALTTPVLNHFCLPAQIIPAPEETKEASSGCGDPSDLRERIAEIDRRVDTLNQRLNDSDQYGSNIEDEFSGLIRKNFDDISRLVVRLEKAEEGIRLTDTCFSSVRRAFSDRIHDVEKRIAQCEQIVSADKQGTGCQSQKKAAQFTAYQMVEAIDAWLELGEMAKEKKLHHGFFSDQGYGARVLRAVRKSIQAERSREICDKKSQCITVNHSIPFTRKDL